MEWKRRYPDDSYDRIWDSDQYYLDATSTSTHSITHQLKTAAVADVAPMIVLQSDRFNYHNQTLSYSFPLFQPTGKYLMNTYFGELYNKNGPIFKVSVNDAVLITVDGWPPLSGVEFTVTQVAGWWWNISLLPLTGAPQINGLEIFEIVQLKHTSNAADGKVFLMWICRLDLYIGSLSEDIAQRSYIMGCKCVMTGLVFNLKRYIWKVLLACALVVCSESAESDWAQLQYPEFTSGLGAW